MPYLTTQECEDKLELLSLTFPTLCQRLALSNQTYEGRTSHALSIRTGPKDPRACVYLIGGVHAREWGSPDILLFFAESLLTSYQHFTDIVLLGKTYPAALIRPILEKLEVLIFPVVNPDGRTYSQTIDIWWRKNRAPTASLGTFGIDINRNYDFLWDYPVYYLPGYLPASHNPSYETYCGTGAWSESETRNVKELVDARPYTRVFVDVHSSGQMLLYPWGDDGPQTSDPAQNFQNAVFNGMRGNTTDTIYREFIQPVDQARFQNVTQRLNVALGQVRGKAYTPGPSATTLYIVSGDSKDYMYARHIVDRTKRKIDSYLIEWGQQFQPPYTEMTNIINDISAVLIELCLAAQDLPLVDKSPDPLDFKRVRLGTTKTLSLTMQNRGAGAVEFTSIQIVGNGFASSVAGLGPITEGATENIPVTFSPTIGGPFNGLLTVEFRQPGGNITDRTDIQLVGFGCDVARDACAAPVFAPINWFVCLFMWIVAPALLAMMAILIWIPGMKCTIKRYMFRLNNCITGNDDPCHTL